MPQLCIEVWCHAELAEKIVEYCNSSHFAEIGMSVGISPLYVPKDEAATFKKKH